MSFSDNNDSEDSSGNNTSYANHHNHHHNDGGEDNDFGVPPGLKIAISGLSGVLFGIALEKGRGKLACMIYSFYNFENIYKYRFHFGLSL